MPEMSTDFIQPVLGKSDYEISFAMSGTLHKANHCFSGRVERRCIMARSANPDQDFSAGYRNAPDLKNWRADPPASLDDLFRSEAIRERIGRLIAIAMARDAAREGR